MAQQIRDITYWFQSKSVRPDLMKNDPLVNLQSKTNWSLTKVKDPTPFKTAYEENSRKLWDGVNQKNCR
jgi:hypothetical protein